jgi:hypothetical protein
MKKIYLSTLLFLIIGLGSAKAQTGVSINTDGTDPDASAILDVKSTGKGLLIPRMDLAARNLIGTPATGLLIFQTDATPGFYFYNGTSWEKIAAGSSLSASLDNGKIFVGNISNTAIGVDLSGDATINNAGVITISNDAISNSKILNDAVGNTKIQDGAVTTSKIADNAVDGTKINLTGNANGDLMYYNGTDWVRLATGSNGEVLKVVGGIPAWGVDANNTYTGSTSVTLNAGSFERAALTGDVTAPANSNTATIANNAVTTTKINNDAVDNTKLSNMATQTIKGRNTAGTGDPEDLTPAQVRTILNVADGANNYVHPTQSAIDVDATNNGINVIDRVQVNTLGHVTSVTTRDLSNATTTNPGVMSAADKTKLDGIATGATANTGTVTSVATNNGITGGTITTTGTIGLTGNALSLHNLATNGLVTRTAANTLTSRSVATSGNGISISNGDGVAGNPTLSLNIGTGATQVAAGNHTHATLTRGAGLTGNNYDGSTATTWAVDFGNATLAGNGLKAQGNFGQFQPHGTYTDFNTNPAYWGWNYVQNNTNAPNATSSQWYRQVVSLGSDYPARGAGGYSLELAFPRYSHSAAGVWMRTVENGGIGGWTRIDAGAIGSGTTNYVTKWTSATTIGNSQIFDNGTNVGVGTNNPQSKLHVTDRVELSRMGLVGTYNSAEVQQIWSIGRAYNINTANNDFGNSYGIAYAHTNAGTATNKKPIANWGHQILFTHDGVRNASISLTNGNAFFAGNVGVNNTAPTERLHVIGNSLITGGINTGSNGTYNTFNTWTNLPNFAGFYSSNHNGAHFYPNNGSYGGWRMDGSRNSWHGLEFGRTTGGNISLMVGTTGQNWGGQTTGMHNNAQGWLWRFEHQTLYAAGFIDTDNTGFYMNPNGTSRLQSIHTDANLLNWPGYNGLAQAQGHYVWPGRSDGGGSWQQSWYLSSHGSWGLYTNTGLNVASHIFSGNNRVIDAGGGWHRSYGQAGWYSETYGGGWWMQDGTWLRTYNNRAILASGGLAGYGNLTFGTPFGMSPRIYANYDNAGSGGLMVSDDGGFADYNDGWIQYRGSNGILVRTNNTSWVGQYTMNNAEGGGGLNDKNLGTSNANWGTVGSSGLYWYRMYAGGFVNSSRTDCKRNITKINSSISDYLLSDIDNLSTYLYKYKEETDNMQKGIETKYRPNWHIGLLVEEAPDYLQDETFMGIDIYAASSLSLFGVKHNRQEIKEIKEIIGDSENNQKINDFGSVILNGTKVFVEYDEAFSIKLNKNTIPVITLTSNDPSVQLAILEKTENGFFIQSSKDVTNLNVDYIVFAKVNKNEKQKELVSQEILNGLKVDESNKQQIKNYLKAKDLEQKNLEERSKQEAIIIRENRLKEIGVQIGDPAKESNSEINTNTSVLSPTMSTEESVNYELNDKKTSRIDKNNVSNEKLKLFESIPTPAHDLRNINPISSDEK